METENSKFYNTNKSNRKIKSRYIINSKRNIKSR